MTLFRGGEDLLGALDGGDQGVVLVGEDDGDAAAAGIVDPAPEFAADGGPIRAPARPSRAFSRFGGFCNLGDEILATPGKGIERGQVTLERGPSCGGQ